jgi:hypothetical protein
MSLHFRESGVTLNGGVDFDSGLTSEPIAALQTMGTEEAKSMVLSVTLIDGNNVKYLIKLPTTEKLETAAKDGVSKEKVSSQELEKLGTALSTGDNPLPMGVALKISQVAKEAR